MLQGTNMEYSEGFIHDLGNLLDLCVKNNTDSLSIMFDMDDKCLDVNITFGVSENKNWR